MTNSKQPPEQPTSDHPAYPLLEPDKLEEILAKLENGIIITNPGGCVTMFNGTACQILGLDQAEIIGRPIEEAIQHPDLLEIFDKHKKHPSRSEINLDNNRVFIAQSTQLAKGGLVVILQEITYLKELDRIKTDFVYTVSHDLRSPLTAILGYIELISRVGPLNDQQREFIHRVQFSVNNITALINDLLDLGRVEAGLDARMEVIRLQPLVQEVVDSLRQLIKEKKHQVTMDVPADLPAILGNPIRLRQMLNNLLSNAIKYTPNLGRICIQGRSEEGQIIFQVIDDGPGIPVADQPYVFEKFYRGSNVSYDAPGSGLGLAIVQTIVQNHRGRIWLDSTPGQGTTFTVVLPISEDN